ncbi:MAG: VTT domain-containing protein [Bacteroidales bacterium]|nr:VTT domain-containing protein [Bacteroidales bacterium]
MRNLLRGLIWLCVIIIIFILFKKFVSPNYLTWLEPVYDNPTVVYLVFLASEVIVGIVPPEVFFIWALRNGSVSDYAVIITVLAIISYLAGITGYFIGLYLQRTLFFQYLKAKFLGKAEKHLHTYGPYLIIVAAFTPLPFSGVSMLVGSIRYSFKKYLLYSLTRFLRFWTYSWFIWEANMI